MELPWRDWYRPVETECGRLTLERSLLELDRQRFEGERRAVSRTTGAA